MEDENKQIKKRSPHTQPRVSKRKHRTHGTKHHQTRIEDALKISYRLSCFTEEAETTSQI